MDNNTEENREEIKKDQEDFAHIYTTSQNSANQNPNDNPNTHTTSGFKEALSQRLLSLPLHLRFTVIGIIMIIIVSLSGYTVIKNRSEKNAETNNVLIPTSTPTQNTSTTPGAFYLPIESPTPTQAMPSTPTQISHSPTSIPPTNTPQPTQAPTATNTPVPPTATPTPQPPALNGFAGPYTGWSSPYSGSPGGVCFVINYENLVNPGGGNTWEYSWQLDSGDWSSWSVQHAIYCFGNITGSHTVRAKPRINGTYEGSSVSKDFSI